MPTFIGIKQLEILTCRIPLLTKPVETYRKSIHEAAHRDRRVQIKRKQFSVPFIFFTTPYNYRLCDANLPIQRSGYKLQIVVQSVIKPDGKRGKVVRKVVAYLIVILPAVAAELCRRVTDCGPPAACIIKAAKTSAAAIPRNLFNLFIVLSSRVSKLILLYFAQERHNLPPLHFASFTLGLWFPVFSRVADAQCG